MFDCFMIIIGSCVFDGLIEQFVINFAVGFIFVACGLFNFWF